MGIEIAGLRRLHRQHAIVTQLIELLAEYSTLAAGEEPLPEIYSRGWEAPYGPGVALVSAEPVVVEGFRSLLSSSPLRLTAVCADLPEAMDRLDPARPELLIFHPNSPSFFDRIDALRKRSTGCATVLWLERISMEMAGRAVESGVRGILPTTSPSDRVLEALNAIAHGEIRLDLPSKACLPVHPDVRLSKGQRKLLGLVGQGLKNKEIATVLGSTEGTVKTSLNRLHKALGLKDRLEVALYAMEVQASTDSFLGTTNPYLI